MKGYKKRWLLLLAITSGIITFSETFDEANAKITENNILTAGTYTGEGNGSVVNTKDDTRFEGEVNFDVTSTGGESRVQLSGHNVSVDTLNINIMSKDDTHSRPKGLWLMGDSNATVKDLDVNIALRSKITGSVFSAESNAAYGVALGINKSNVGAGDPSKETNLVVDNMNIVVKNTSDTIINTTNIRGIADVYFTHQLSGLRLTREQGTKVNFISNKTSNIHVEDISKTKSGDYLAGIYVSGKESLATFNGDTNITIVGEGENSAAIKIGKPVESFEVGKAPKVIINGKLNIDTTKMPNSAAIRLFTDNTSLEVTGEKESVIKSANSAVVFDTQDYILNFKVPFLGDRSVTRNSNAENQVVKLKDTKLNTISKSNSLIVVRSEKTIDQSLGEARKFESSLNAGGTFTSKNAIFELYGDKSEAIAADNGWLIEAEAADENISSSIIANIKEGAKIEGLTHKYFGAGLDVNLENEANWKLKNKGLDTNISTLSNLNINNSILDSSMKNMKEGYVVDLTNLPEELKLEKSIRIATITFLEEEDPNDPDLPEAREKLKEVEEKIAKWAKENTSIKKGERAEYIVKLTRDGLESDGKLKNSGTITLHNNSYEDRLSIYGNYEGKDGKLIVNTLWNTPGAKDDSGLNSETDLLEVKGEVSGNTVVTTKNSNGEEAILDGSIGELEDLFAKSKPVIIADIDNTNGTAFTGKVKSSSAADIELSYREKEGKHEYFWEVKKISEIVAKYVAIPSIIYENGYASLQTLNERKGNYIKTSNNTQKFSRIYGGHLSQEGSIRTKHSSAFGGVVLGGEEVNENKHTGLYFSYLGNKAKMYTKKGIKPKKEDKYTYDGIMNTHALSLGLTHTRYSNDGAYIDLVGQFTYNINNIYNPKNTNVGKTTGLGLILSAEGGKPYMLKGGEYIIEPQVQIMYQVNRISDVNVENKNISFDLKHGLRGRVGTRLINEEHTVYGLANLWIDLTNRTSINVGKDKLPEKYDNVWLELGVGGQNNFKNELQMYGDIHLEAGINRFGFKTNLGLKKYW